MAINNSVAPKGGNTQLAGALIPEYSSVALGLGYPGSVATDFPNFSNSYGNTEWRNGIDMGATANGSNDANIFYAIYSDEFSQGYGTLESNVVVGWGITGSTETDILNTINRLPAMSTITKHANYIEAINWLISEEKYLPVNRDYPQISYNTATPLVAAYDPSFMASYPLTGGSMYDLSGYSGAPGALLNSTYWNSSSKNAMVFNGGTDYIEFGSIATLDTPTSGMTISIWFKVTYPDSGTIATLFQLSSNASGNAAPANGIWSRIYIDSSGGIFYDGDPQQQGVDPPTPVPNVKLYEAVSAGSWHNLVVSIDGINPTNNIKSSLDGASIVIDDYSFLVTGPFNTGGVANSYMGCSIGAGSVPAADTFFTGSIGALHIYKGLLTEDQIKDIYVKTNSIYA
jgi:hypothetical protein